MTEGTGPGRGTPWWRRAFLAVTLTRQPGAAGAEQAGRKREGRTVKKIKGRDEW